jgi:two-component system sensor histidine kinase AlgZ
LKIPLLTLQPLLENAIYHGIQPLPEGGTVEVKLRYDGEIVNVEISNPMPPLQSRGLSKGNQMAINNIKSRLSVLYGNTAALAVETRDEIYVTTLRYPFRADG